MRKQRPRGDGSVFVVLPLIRWLANHQNRWVVMGVGAVLVGAAIGIAAVGFVIHQPAVARIGVFLMVASIVYGVFASRSRHVRTDAQDSRDRPV